MARDGLSCHDQPESPWRCTAGRKSGITQPRGNHAVTVRMLSSVRVSVSSVPTPLLFITIGNGWRPTTRKHPSEGACAMIVVRHGVVDIASQC